MNHMKRNTLHFITVSLFTVLILFLLGTSSGLAQTNQSNADQDYFALIIDFVVSRDAVLDAQRQVMQAAVAMDTVKPGDVDNIPVHAQGSLLKQKFDAVASIQQAQQAYVTLERNLVSALFSNLTKVLSLRNQIENNQHLLKLLTDRLEPTERQVTAGIVRDDVLWNLSERIIAVQIAIADGKSQLVALERETAFNYGGDNWAELLELIRNL